MPPIDPSAPLASSAPPPHVLGEPFPAGPEAALSTAELADLAWRRVSDAMRRGRVYEARAWVKLAAEMKARLHAEEWQARQAEKESEAPDAALDLAATSLGAIGEAMRAVIATAKLGMERVAGASDAVEEDGDDDMEEDDADDLSWDTALSLSPTTHPSVSPGLVPGAHGTVMGVEDCSQSDVEDAKTNAIGPRNESGGDGGGVELHPLHPDVEVQSQPGAGVGPTESSKRRPREFATPCKP